MIVLGIESSCDETACSIVEGGQKILSNVVYSQQHIHQKYGGVYPEVACREHIDALIPVIKAAIQEAGVSFQDINLIAVAKGPGLIGALLIGLMAAKTLSYSWDIPFIGVNHVEAHLYSAMMEKNLLDRFPALGVVISGGHTFIAHMSALGDYTLLGSTVDDAIGEAFDKVATLLGLPYPGGPGIEALAVHGNPKAFSFTAGIVKGKKFDFSFSGLKTSVLYAIKHLTSEGQTLTPQQKADIAASFQEVAFAAIVDRSLEAARLLGVRAIFLGGGVSCNERLKKLFEEEADEIELFWPPKALCVDNAAMIAGLGFHQYQIQGHGDSLDLEPMTRIPLKTFQGFSTTTTSS